MNRHGTRAMLILAAALVVAPSISAGEIHDAARCGSLAEVRALVGDDFAQLNTVDGNGRTALHWAAFSGDAELVGYLLEQGAEVDAKDALQATPLVLAAEAGSAEAAGSLLTAGADVDSVGLIGTALHRACFNGHTPVVQRLLEADADTGIVSRGFTPLHMTALTGQPESAAALIRGGARINSTDSHDRTPLHLALSASHPRVSEMAAVFLESGAAVNSVNDRGEAPLWTAVSGGYAGVVRHLLMKGADSGVRDETSGRGLLHLAAVRGYVDVTELLIAHDLDPKRPDRQGLTPIHLACVHMNPGVVNTLIEAIGQTVTLKTGDHGIHFDGRSDEPGQAMVWPLRGRGWAVKTAGHLLVFDQEETGRAPDLPLLANGCLAAEEIGSWDVLALYTCYHAEPGTLEFIHGLEDSLRSVTYVHREADPWRGGRNSVYMEGQQTKELGKATVSAAELDETSYSMDYLVEADGLMLFYSGFYHEDTDAFRREIDFLAGRGKGCDLAFIDSSDGDGHQRAAYIMDKLSPKAVFPMNPDRDAAECRQLAQWLKQKYPEILVGVAENPGEGFAFDASKPDLRRAVQFFPRNAGGGN